MTGSNAEELAGDLVAAFAARRPLGAGSFIVTLYGDAVVPRGGLIWLGNVIAVCGGVGISETLVRTAVSRLVSGGHLEGSREGRRSFYRLTETSRQAFDEAAAVIYGGPKRPSAESWSLLVLPGNGTDEAGRRLLADAGYGLLAPGVALRAGEAAAGAAPIAGALRFDARLADGEALEGLRDLAAEAWSLAALAARYDAFCRRFAPLLQALQAAEPTPLDPERALVLRLLLVHDYRHVVLDDPGLPAELLPEGWQGAAAQRLFSRLYRTMSPAAEAAIDAAFVDGAGGVTADPAILARRLAALQRRAVAEESA